MAGRLRRQAWFWPVILLALMSLGRSPVVHAEVPAVCPDRFPAAPPEGISEKKQQLRKLARFTLACEERADYHAYRGALLLTAGQVEDAALALEKALMLDSELPGAQIDYAQALAELGQRQAARSLVLEVAQRPDISTGLHDWLFESFIDPDWLGSNRWYLGGQVQVTAGYESNLNSATHAETLTLLLSGQPVTIPLADTERPRAGSALRTRLTSWGIYRQGDREWRFLAVAGQRHEISQEAGGLQNLEAGIEHVWRGALDNISLGLGTQDLWYDQQRFYAENSLRAGYQQSIGRGCQWGVAASHALQTYPQSELLDGRYTSARLEFDCGSERMAQTRIAIGAGLDKPDAADRPGGDKERHEIELRNLLPLWGGQLNSWLILRQSKDKEIFSELLGEKRAHTRRYDMGVGYWQQVGERLSVGVDLEITSQRSNISLYEIENRLIYAGVRWSLF